MRVQYNTVSLRRTRAYRCYAGLVVQLGHREWVLRWR